MSRHARLAAGGAFLSAVVWMDLMFDVQVFRHPGPGDLPEAVLASVAAYYRRVTTDADPMSRLVGLVMILTATDALLDLRHTTARALRAVAAALCLLPITLATTRVFPNAIQLGKRLGDLATQSALARSIATDHVACFTAIASFTLVELALSRRPSPPR